MLEVELAGRKGETPHLRFGDRVALLAARASLVIGVLADRRREPADGLTAA